MSLFPMAQWVKNLPTMKEARETLVQSLSWEDLLERKWQPTPGFLPEKYHEQGACRDTVQRFVKNRI